MSTIDQPPKPPENDAEKKPDGPELAGSHEAMPQPSDGELAKKAAEAEKVRAGLAEDTAAGKVHASPESKPGNTTEKPSQKPKETKKKNSIWGFLFRNLWAGIKYLGGFAGGAIVLADKIIPGSTTGSGGGGGHGSKPAKKSGGHSGGAHH